jgi:predicted nicotinamide N-methyase
VFSSLSACRSSFAGSGDTLGARVWTAAPLLCQTLIATPHATVVGKRVLELGCGVGLPGILAAILGASEVRHLDELNSTR